ncbi:MAG: nitrogen fixation protein NifH [Anaerolineae bacterium]|nr:nitrogen fixation protein NifH [Anaerolineae bacterium]
MTDWTSHLRADPTDWLLAPDNPSVRYFALAELDGVPIGDPRAVDAKAAIMRTGVVPQVLAKQEDGGYWGDPKRFYDAKYTGTVWQLMILAEHLADGGDERIRKACEFLLEHSQDLASGGFAMHRSAKLGGGRHTEVLPCLTGNMVWSMIRLGWGADSRVQRGIEWITTYQRFDDAVADPPQGWPYDKFEVCWGRHTCHMGAVKALKALAETPEGERSADVQRTIDAGVEYLLKHHIHKRSHDLTKVAKPGWLRFGFPLMYQTDALEILEILTRLGCRDSRMQEAVDVLVSRQDSTGKWTLANTFNGRFLVDVEEIGKPSKWITLNALRVLKRYYA